MGNCFNVDATSKAVDKQLDVEKTIEERTSKILFLGSGGGGKSTIFKQLGQIYNGSYEVAFDHNLQIKIYTHITEQMQAALKLWDTSNENNNNNKLNESIEIVENHKDLTTFPETLSNAIEFIWQNDSTLRKSINSMKFKHKILEETTVYFFNELQRIKQPNYIPNDLDYLYLRHRTTGIVQRHFTINYKRFHIFDVGGQVSERKKWINCFDNVTALLFVVSLSCFNQTMFEHKNKNCMVDCMEVFGDICNNKIFDKSDMILFLNKRDLFAEKIKNIPITDCPEFEDFLEYKDMDNIIKYNDKNNYDQCCKYIQSKFNELNYTNKIIYTHFICAMEKENIQSVFDDVRNIILMQNTKEIVSVFAGK